MSALAKETGLPKSAFYHHFESKAGLLSAVMAQGAQGFFGAMREAHRNPPEGGTPRERLGWYLRGTGEALEHQEELLRLLVLVMSREAAEAPEALRTVITVRDEGRAYMRHMIHSSFLSAGEDTASRVAAHTSGWPVSTARSSPFSRRTGRRSRSGWTSWPTRWRRSGRG